MLCYCKSVRYGTVRKSIARTGARDVETVTLDCDAGAGCRTCHPEIEDLIKERKAENPGWIKRLVGLFGSRS